MAEGFGVVPDGNMPKSFIEAYVKKHEALHEKLSKFCTVTLEKLELHPSTPVPDFEVESLSEEDSKEMRERVVQDIDSVIAQDYELRDFVEAHDLLTGEDAALLHGPPGAEPARQSRLQRFRSVLTRKKGPTEHAEEWSIWKIVRRIKNSWFKDYDKLKASFRKFLRSKRQPTKQKKNTPDTREEATRDEMECMIKDVHLTQFCLKAYKEKIEAFDNMFQFLKIHESCEALLKMNEACSKKLKSEMQTLVTYAASADFLVYDMDARNRGKSVFRDLHNQYEEQIAKREAKRRSRQDKTSKKGKRKSGKEDEEQLLDSDSDSPSPKRSKDEDEEEQDVRRRLRRTSVSDNDDE